MNIMVRGLGESQWSVHARGQFTIAAMIGCVNYTYISDRVLWRCSWTCMLNHTALSCWAGKPLSWYLHSVFIVGHLRPSYLSCSQSNWSNWSSIGKYMLVIFKEFMFSHTISLCFRNGHIWLLYECTRNANHPHNGTCLLEHKLQGLQLQHSSSYCVVQ